MSEIQRYIEIKNISQLEFSHATGINKFQISRLVNGKIELSRKYLEKILQVYPDFGIALNSNNNAIMQPNDSKNLGYSNEKKSTIRKYSEEIKISDKTFREVPIINRFAYASYSEGWDDPEFFETMQTMPTPHLEDGNYLWFEVKGDSMTRDEDPSINERDMVLGRELQRHHWMGLQLRRAKVWVINHREQGLMIKEIVKQEGNIIHCFSWNPIVPPFQLNLDDVNQLFYIKEMRKSFIF